MPAEGYAQPPAARHNRTILIPYGQSDHNFKAPACAPRANHRIPARSQAIRRIRLQTNGLRVTSPPPAGTLGPPLTKKFPPPR